MIFDSNRAVLTPDEFETYFLRGKNIFLVHTCKLNQQIIKIAYVFRYSDMGAVGSGCRLQ